MSDSKKIAKIDNMPGNSSFQWKSVLGMVSCILACEFFSCMNGFCKQLYNTSNVTAWEIIYWRSLALVIFNAIIAQVDGSSMLVVPKKLGWSLFWKVLSGIVCVIFMFYQTKVMSFSKSTAIYFVYPAFTMLFAYLIMNEQITRYDVISCAVSFIGVIVIVFDPNGSKKINDVEEEPIWAPIIPILGAAFCAVTDVYTRVLGTDVHCTVSPGYFGLGGLFIFGIALGDFSSTNTTTHYNTETIINLFVVSISGFVSQILLTIAFQFEKAGRIAILSYLQVVNACLIDIFIFKIPITVLQYFGIILIVSSGGGLMILKGLEIIK